MNPRRPGSFDSAPPLGPFASLESAFTVTLLPSIRLFWRLSGTLPHAQRAASAPNACPSGVFTMTRVPVNLRVADRRRRAIGQEDAAGERVLIVRRAVLLGVGARQRVRDVHVARQGTASKIQLPS